MIGALLFELADVPELPGAACMGRADLFDATVNESRSPSAKARRATAEARQAARRVCVNCPALEPCWAWVESLPLSRRPKGIVGGHLIDGSGRCPAAEARKRKRRAG